MNELQNINNKNLFGIGLNNFAYTIEINARQKNNKVILNIELSGDNNNSGEIITRYGSIRIRKEALPKNVNLFFLSLMITFLKELTF